MLPYGKDNKMRRNLPDCHPKKYGKGFKNWWEVELTKIIKKRERQSAKDEIIKILNEDISKGERSEAG